MVDLIYALQTGATTLPRRYQHLDRSKGGKSERPPFDLDIDFTYMHKIPARTNLSHVLTNHATPSESEISGPGTRVPSLGSPPPPPPPSSHTHLSFHLSISEYTFLTVSAYFRSPLSGRVRRRLECLGHRWILRGNPQLPNRKF